MYHGKEFNSRDEVANYIKNTLENIFGASFSDSKSLASAYRKWSLKNHPDKVAPADREKADERIKEVNNLVADLKKFKGWN